MRQLFGLVYLVIIDLVVSVKYHDVSEPFKKSDGISVQEFSGRLSSSSVSNMGIDINFLRRHGINSDGIIVQDVSALKELCGIFDHSFTTPSYSPPSYGDSVDISKLYNAINAKNPKENAIINILAPTNVDDRNKIRTKYQRTYGISLVNDLKDKLTGKFEEAVVALMTPSEYYHAQEIHDAIYGIRADEKALIDTLCIFNNSYLESVRTAYLQHYNRNMESELSTNTLGNFKNLMLSCIQKVRSDIFLNMESHHSDVKYVNQDDDINHDNVINFMTTSSFPDISQYTMSCYKSTGKPLENIIKDKFSGDFQRALLHIVNYAKGEQEFLAKRLHESLEEKEVDHRSLIRLAIMDKNIDYIELQYSYGHNYQKSLYNVIKSKIPPGSYRTLIEALLHMENVLYVQ